MSEVTMEKKETMREKVKGFYQKHELGFVQLGACVSGLAAIGAGCWLGNACAAGRMELGLRRMFDVNPELESGFLNTIKLLKEIDEKRNANFK